MLAEHCHRFGSLQRSGPAVDDLFVAQPSAEVGRGDQSTAGVRSAAATWRPARGVVPLRAAEELPERVEAWHAKARVPTPRIKVVSQAKRWGSCDQAWTIRLSWRIIQAPMRLVDYVVVHELVHLRHRGHGRDHWQAVGRVMPDYERRRRDLRERGAFLVWWQAVPPRVR